MHSLLECTALALGREYSVKQQVRSRQETIQERYRSNLLRAISHDLRTPLSGIMGTSEMIMDMSDKKRSQVRAGQRNMQGCPLAPCPCGEYFEPDEASGGPADSCQAAGGRGGDHR